jgi:lipid A 3-O-deacylase
MSNDWGQSDWAQKVAAFLPGIEPGDGLSAGIGLGHYLYVPRNVTTSAPLPNQRAYAGWLHGSAMLAGETANRLDTWKLDVGVVGPAAEGEQLVKVFHAAFSGRDMNGWDNQIRNRLGVEVAWERRWRNVLPVVGGLQTDVSPAVGVEAGSVSVGASAGLMLRLGFGLENDFGPPRAMSLGGSLMRRNHGVSGYLFASANERWSGYDVFVDEPGGRDGDAIRGGSAITREAWRNELSFGAVVDLGPARATFAWTQSSRLYEQQPGPHQFGEVTLGWTF